MEKKQMIKRVAWILLAVMGGLVFLAVLLGVLNATVADGKWDFGWHSYRYDDTGYSVGDGTVPVTSIRRIELDWIDGEVLIEACEDRYPSLTESAAAELSDSAKLRWRVSEDGSTLYIKYRAPSTYFGSTDRNKKLILRLPVELMQNLESLTVKVDSSDTMLQDITAERFLFESDAGNLIAKECHFTVVDSESDSGAQVYESEVHTRFSAESDSGTVRLISDTVPREVRVETDSGDVRLTLPKELSATVDWETERGRMTSDFQNNSTGSSYRVGNGDSRFTIETDSGDFALEIRKP